jgi:hypothetical protein
MSVKHFFLYFILSENMIKHISIGFTVIFPSFSYLRHLFEYIGTQFPPPFSLLYGKMGSIYIVFFKWEY